MTAKTPDGPPARLLAVTYPHDTLEHTVDGAPPLDRAGALVPAEHVDAVKQAAKNLGVRLTDHAAPTTQES